MKKAIYFLMLSATVLFVACVLGQQEVKTLKYQTIDYLHIIEHLEEQHDLDSAIIFELESELEYTKTQQKRLKNMIENQVKTIMELTEYQKENIADGVNLDTNDVTIVSNIGAKELEMALIGQNKKLSHLAPKYVEIEKKYGINALFLAGLTAWESGWGTSDYAIYKNNIGGVKNPGGNDYRAFTSQEACLEYIASFLSMSYLDENGKYYNGKSIKGIAEMYNFGDEEWIKGITSVARGLKSKADSK